MSLPFLIAAAALGTAEAAHSGLSPEARANAQRIKQLKELQASGTGLTEDQRRAMEAQLVDPLREQSSEQLSAYGQQSAGAGDTSASTAAQLRREQGAVLAASGQAARGTILGSDVAQRKANEAELSGRLTERTQRTNDAIESISKPAAAIAGLYGAKTGENPDFASAASSDASKKITDYDRFQSSLVSRGWSPADAAAFAAAAKRNGDNYQLAVAAAAAGADPTTDALLKKYGAE